MRKSAFKMQKLHFKDLHGSAHIMRLDWIDDILAVLDHGSLAGAAERRFLTQSAFTRRVRAIEDALGTTLFDRSRKPVVLLPGVRGLEDELRATSARLHRLRRDLVGATQTDSRTIAFACQHAITTTVSPWVVEQLTADTPNAVRVRSGNRDECLMLLLAGEVDFAIMYAVKGDRAYAKPEAFQSVRLGGDMLIPVCKPALAAALVQAEIPTVSYPGNVFLGRIFDQRIAPQLPPTTVLVPKAETALTLAMCEYALSGIGIAWLPRSIVLTHLARGSLVMLDALPSQRLDIRLVRASGDSQRTETLWPMLVDGLRASFSERFPEGLPGFVQTIKRAEQR